MLTPSRSSSFGSALTTPLRPIRPPLADTNNEILAHIPKGEHGEGIYSWKLDGDTGKLTGPVTVSPIGPNPAFIMKHPTKDVLYASTECIHKEKCGEIITLGVGEDGVSLKELGRVSAGGR